MSLWWCFWPHSPQSCAEYTPIWLHQCSRIAAARWRGAAPIQRAIEAGDKESGITIMQMEAGLDTGPMLNQTRVAITGAMTGGELHDALASVGPAALDEVLLDLPGAIERAERQNDSLASYAHKLSKPEMAIGWTDHADLLARRIQAFSPMPGCYGLLDGTRIKFLGGKAVSKDSNAAPGTILEASQDGLFVACAEGQLCITRAQLPGGRPMTTTELLNGQQDRFRVERFSDSTGFMKQMGVSARTQAALLINEVVSGHSLSGRLDNGLAKVRPDGAHSMRAGVGHFGEWHCLLGLISPLLKNRCATKM